MITLITKYIFLAAQLHSVFKLDGECLLITKHVKSVGISHSTILY